MKLVALVISIISLSLFVIGNFVWLGYACYELFITESPFWVTIGYSLLGWGVTSLVTLAIGIASYFYGNN